MSDQLGRITVPSIALSTGGSGLSGTQVFPLVSWMPYGMAVDRPVIVHRLGSLAAKQEQRYYTGLGPRRFQFKRPNLSWTEMRALRAFWEDMQGSWKAFTYSVPNPDKTTTDTLVTFDDVPLTLEYLRTACQVGLTFVEVVSTGATPLQVNSVCSRFPSSALSSALLSEVQEIVPLVHIRVREAAVPDIWLSDRRVTLSDNGGGTVRAAMGWAASSQVYLPRLTGIGEPGSDVFLSQDIRGSSDNVHFTFGNADRVMTALANDTDLKYASIDLCLLHVNSGIILQLWNGVIQSFQSDGTSAFPVTCSDGFFQIMNQYPERQTSRQCWKYFNDGKNCPYIAHGSGLAYDPAQNYVEGAHIIYAGAAYVSSQPVPPGQQPDISPAYWSPDQCDYYLESPKGCQVHGMAPYFGGQQVDPQGVQLLDDSTGFLGLGRNMVTSTSIVSETIWGVALPEIWCNSGGNPANAFIAKALIAAYRDESTYSDSLGIVGAGPIGGYTPSQVATNADGYRFVVCPQVDGFNWQGFKVAGNLNVSKYQPGMGLRQITGSDPADPNYDYFSLGDGTPQVWQPNNYSAGTAFCEVRVQKDAKIQPSTPDKHVMMIPIDYGMWGWVWDASGTRSAVKGLINPFWIAVNMLLRALGLYGDPSTGKNPAGAAGPASADQLATFLLSSLVAGNGSGTAEIAAAQVPAILGAGTETQFQFQGTISSQKPFRDWLAEVLNCSLGYYTWQFGKLKLGCRINASATDAYTIGNILFQSLRLAPITAAFEHLIISYADVAYQYQANTADYCDKSHAAYYGRPGSPLTSQMHSVGLSTLSQALRIAATRTREEVGGVTPTEWRNARNASWQTTLLGLGNEVGQVVSMTHPDIPGSRGTCNTAGSTATWVRGDKWTYAGSSQGDTELVNKAIVINGQQLTITAVASDGSSITTNPAPPSGLNLQFQVITMCFRIQRWSLSKDWSVQIQGQTVTASMYDLDVGPKPVDVAPGPVPALFYPIPLGPAWAPYQVQAAAADALFAGEWNFDIDETYSNLAQGVQAAILVTGDLPINTFSPTGAGAPKIGTVSQARTGGSLPSGVALRVAICALDANGIPSAPSNIVIIGTSSGTDTFTLSDITWPAVTGLASYVLFAATQDDLICAQATGALTPTGDGTTYTPGSTIFGGPLARSTWALPSPYVANVRIKGKIGRHFGVLGAGVAPNGISTNTIVSGDLVDTSSTPFNATGRVLSIVGRQAGSTPFANFKITAHDPATGTLTLDRDPSGIVQPGDAFVIRCQAAGLAPGQYTQVIDPGYLNSLNGYAGMTPGAEVGNLIRIVGGTGRGQAPSQITGNTATELTFQPPLTMDSTSVWIVETPNWTFQADSTSGPTATLTPTQIGLAVQNYLDQPVVIAGFTVDTNGNESPDGDAPIREGWIFGQPPIVTQVDSDTTLDPVPQTCEADATNDAITITLPPFAQWLGDDITIVKVDDSANAVTWKTSSDNDVITGLGTSGTLTAAGQGITITATQP